MALQDFLYISAHEQWSPCTSLTSEIWSAFVDPIRKVPRRTTGAQKDKYSALNLCSICASLQNINGGCSASRVDRLFLSFKFRTDHSLFDTNLSRDVVG